MSKRAEKAAVRIAYQRKEFKYKDSHYQDGLYDGAIEGYEQAEKDLALTWRDVMQICDLFLEINYNQEYDTIQDKYEKILKEFNEWREKK